MTRGEDIIKNGKCKINHCWSMSKSAWCDLNWEGDLLKLHDKFPNPKGNSQKFMTFTPHQYMLQRGSIKSKLEKNFKRTKKAWYSFIEPGLKMATPLVSAALAAKTKNPQSAQITNNILKSLTSGRVLSLTDMHGGKLELKVMYF